MMWQFISFVIDYGFVFFNVLIMNYVFSFGTNYFTFQIKSLLFALLYQSREQLYFWLMGENIAKAKRDYSLTWENYKYALQTLFIFSANNALMQFQGFLYWEPLTFSMKTFMDVLVPFYILQILKDVISLGPFHKLMHTNDTMKAFHEAHHEVKHNCQCLMALHIGVIDLVIENGVAPILYLAARAALGLPMQVHIAAIFFGGSMDILIHSVNPYSSCLFNPILDMVFKCNLAHHVHHGMLTKNYTFIPYHHIFDFGLTDASRYNKIMKTNFDFSFLSSLGFSSTDRKSVKKAS